MGSARDLLRRRRRYRRSFRWAVRAHRASLPASRAHNARTQIRIHTQIRVYAHPRARVSRGAYESKRGEHVRARTLKRVESRVHQLDNAAGIFEDARVTRRFFRNVQVRNCVHS